MEVEIYLRAFQLCFDGIKGLDESRPLLVLSISRAFSLYSPFFHWGL